MTLRKSRFALAAVAVAVLATTVAGAATGGSASPGLLPAQWVGTWQASQALPGPANPAFAGFTNQSVRMVVRSSISGEAVRVRVSNAFGPAHLALGHATIGLPDTSTPTNRTDVKPGSVRELTFSGATSPLIPRGGYLFSDPVQLNVPALSELVVTLYLPVASGVPTFHNEAIAESYFGDGDLTADLTGAGFTGARTHFYFLTGVEMLTRRSLGSVVIIGDSFANGNGSTLNANKRFPDQLADRIIHERPFGPFEVGVLNGAIAGNHITAHDGAEVGGPGFGVSVLARLDRDAFGQAGVRLVFICGGFNDIELSGETADHIIASLKQAALQVKAQGLIVIGCTITPVEGFFSHTPEHEATRQTVNQYLRTTHDFNKVIDFDAVVRDPAQPSRLRPDIDSGDHIHPNDAGYLLVAKAIPLNLIN
jgi:lysophospholipase L1-like esterase